MDLPRFMSTINVNAAPPRAPRVLLYIPPHGSPVHCPDVESAKAAAENYAAERPGVTVGVYELIGYAHKPVEKPTFQDTEQALAALLTSEPDGGVIGGDPDGDVEIERPDLNRLQREQLEHLRSAARADRSLFVDDDE